MSNGKLAGIIAGAYVGIGYFLLIAYWYHFLMNDVVVKIFFFPFIGGGFVAYIFGLWTIPVFELALFGILWLLLYLILRLFRRRF